jgi:myosin III
MQNIQCNKSAQRETNLNLNFKIYKATDTMENDRTVAIKIQKYDEEHKYNIEEEYRTLRDCSEHPNLLSFYGVFRKKFNNQADEIWFILEYCEYGSMIDIVKALHSQKRHWKNVMLLILYEN